MQCIPSSGIVQNGKKAPGKGEEAENIWETTARVLNRIKEYN